MTTEIVHTERLFLQYFKWVRKIADGQMRQKRGQYKAYAQECLAKGKVPPSRPNFQRIANSLKNEVLFTIAIEVFSQYQAWCLSQEGQAYSLDDYTQRVCDLTGFDGALLIDEGAIH
jgi:hypothetical protein